MGGGRVAVTSRSTAVCREPRCYAAVIANLSDRCVGWMIATTETGCFMNGF
jgi:hypothetical protein